MKNILIKIVLISLAIFLIMPVIIFAEDLPQELSTSGTIQGTGASFQITGSEYIDVSLESTEEITVLLESIPKTISLNLEASSIIDSTQLILGNLEADTTYYKLEDSYKNKIEFTTNENQNYTWTQNLTQPHHVWFQLGTAIEEGIQTMGIQAQSESDGIMFLPDDCVYPYGNWDGDTSTCALTQDLFESVEIMQNDITLDCGGYSITGDNTGYGIYAYRKSGIVIKNCIITNFSCGMSLVRFLNGTLFENTIINNYAGIGLSGASDNNIIKNTILNNKRGIDLGGDSNNNILTNNTIKDNQNIGLFLHTSCGNTIEDNHVLNNSTGFLLQSSTNTLVNNNRIEGNIVGILFHYGFTESVISNNVFTKGGIYVGVRMNSQPYNAIVKNNTINNKPIVYLENKSN